MAQGSENNSGSGSGDPGQGGGGNPGQGGGNPGSSGDHDKPIEVVVNEKPVTVQGQDQTGLSIKQAAIAQHVQIQLDFVLSIEKGGGKTELVGDNQPIKVHQGERFLAIQNDDNS